jgi:hypothetical protein
MLYSLVEKYQRSEGTGILHLQGISLHLETTLLTWIWMQLIGSKRWHLSTRLRKLPCDLSDSSRYTLPLWWGQNIPPKRHFCCQNQGNHSLNNHCHENLCSPARSTQVTPPAGPHHLLNNPMSAQTSPRKRNVDPTKKHCLKYSASSHPNYPLWLRSYISWWFGRS